jgi:hypothetical protein
MQIAPSVLSIMLLSAVSLFLPYFHLVSYMELFSEKIFIEHKMYNVLMTKEMHNSYNQFLFHRFLSALHVSNKSSRSSSGALHNVLYYTVQSVQLCLLHDCTDCIKYINVGSSSDVIIIVLFDGQNISFDAILVMYINRTNIPPTMIMNRMYENQKVLYIIPLIKHTIVWISSIIPIARECFICVNVSIVIILVDVSVFYVRRYFM